eukprot:m.28688 g.28688  ORF g.28688 m.28688 type:complete len:325 (-) comp9493_c0_seq2:184-1158(-)
MSMWELLLWFGGVGSCLVLLNVLFRKFTRPGLRCKSKHVFITGGTVGLGLCTAIEYAQNGALVTVVSRRQENVNAAVKEIKAKVPNAKAQGFSCDVTDEEQLSLAVSEAQAKFGTIYTLVCCAGTANPGYFLETSVADYRKQMELNYLGTVATAKAVVPSIIEGKEGGTVVFVSSAVAFASMIGYSQYAPSKWAVRAFTDALRNELIPYNIRVVGYYPTSMDTPGFEVEERTKPKETKAIEGQGGLIKPEKAAKNLINGIANGNYSITDDPILELARIASGGLAPRENFFLELFAAPLSVIIGYFYTMDMDKTAKEGPGKSVLE